jgi:HAD superfamily phosphoserine phosphatase-like hydrolase
VTVLLVDVCHTLYAANTTFDFLAQYFLDDPSYQALMKRRASLLNRIKSKILPGPYMIRTEALAYLEGESKASLVASAKTYAKTVMPIMTTQSYVKEQQDLGAAVYLVSSSLDFVVAEIADQLGADGWFASEMKFQEDVCTGELKTDLTGHKDQIVLSNFREQSDVEFISDNFSDANCINLVASFRPVYKRRDIRAKSFWLGKPTGVPITYG